MVKTHHRHKEDFYMLLVVLNSIFFLNVLGFIALFTIIETYIPILYLHLCVYTPNTHKYVMCVYIHI